MTSTPNHDTELEEILNKHSYFWHAVGMYDHATSDEAQYDTNKAKAAINTYLYKQTLELIGEDIPIYSEGERIKHGDPMTMDLSGGINSPRFRESCKNIQENGRNLEKAQLRKAAAERWGQE